MFKNYFLWSFDIINDNIAWTLKEANVSLVWF